MNRELEDRIKSCTSLPTLPSAALRVLQLSANEKAEVSELAEVIGADPALSSSVLRAVNSSFYGISQRVSNIQQAVSLLGIHSVKTLVLSFSLVATVKSQKSRGFNHLTYWRRSMFAAAAARVLALRVLPAHAEESFVAALLMDLGTLVLDQVLGEAYSNVHDRAKTHSDLLILETHSLGMTHAEAGGILAQSWKLPQVLEVPMTSHHTPQAVEDIRLRKITEVVWLAGRCADIFVNERPAESIADLRKTFAEKYQIGEFEADALMVEIGQKTSQLAPLFEVRLNTSSYESILEKASQRLLELSLGQTVASDSPANRRKAARLRRDGKIIVIPCSNGILGAPMQVRLRDLSTCGIGFTHTEALPHNQQFVIQLPNNAGELKNLLYTVARCEPSAGLFSIGAELTAVLRPDKNGAIFPSSAVAMV